jgi:hypothetical protein
LSVKSAETRECFDIFELITITFCTLRACHTFVIIEWELSIIALKWDTGLRDAVAGTLAHVTEGA